ncbi:hypothetical protein EXIGLDRAFT_772980 [Exidia glandulosa HHB12029]|uniref:Uncharacterized protein n=1 Tax=Exidia glandulosa HHB12029 TaxID=1314781 RepID=A0A165F1Q3_EXIGL|nr:hypothetical protein EXIGLDRAFT_772980 [Exidia glandulosa HHB12029]
MPKLRNNASTCPRHSCDIDCNLVCFIELISSFLLQESTEDLDLYVVSQLFDATCRIHETFEFMSLTLSDLPTLLAYVASSQFISRNPSHPSASALGVTAWISRTSSWIQSSRVDPLWFQAWRHAAYVRRLQSTSTAVYGPTDLIGSALSSPGDKHIYRHIWRPFEVPSPPEAILPAILVPDDDLVPSIWNLIATGKDGHPNEKLLTAEVLAASLCTISRNSQSFDDLITSFFTPLKIKELMVQMYFLRPKQSNNTSLSPALALCLHIMELRPSWWAAFLHNSIGAFIDAVAVDTARRRGYGGPHIFASALAQVDWDTVVVAATRVMVEPATRMDTQVPPQETSDY